MTIVDNIEATGKEAAALLVEVVELKQQLADQVPAPTPPPGEAPPPIGVWPPLAVPLFGAGPFIVGTTVTRIGGEYPNAKGIAGRRYRNGTLIPGATGAAYTLTAADAGQVLEFEEQAESTDGVTEWFKSPAVVPIAAAPAPPPPDAGALNAETMIRDMTGKNDFVFKGYESFKDGWYVQGENTMGANPAFDGSQATWSIFYNNPAYKGLVCRAVMPWAVIFDGVDDTSRDTAVEIANAYLFIKRKSTGQWLRVVGPIKMTGNNWGKPNTGLPAETPTLIADYATGSVIKLPVNRGRFWHGWGGKVTIDPNDIAAVHVRMQARLTVVPGRPDDRAAAQLGLQTGADYYLTDSSYYKEGYAPSLVIGRTRRITNAWQWFTCTTLTDGCSQNKGGSGISMAELRANPPPLA